MKPAIAHEEVKSTLGQKDDYKAFLEERIRGLNAVDAMSTHPQFIVFGPNHDGTYIVKITLAPQHVEFQYADLPADAHIMEELIPLTRAYFGGGHG